MNKGRKPRIAMAVSGDLRTDQRVARHVAALREGGCEVTVFSRADLPTRHGRGWRFYAELNWALFRRLRGVEADVLWANDTDTLAGCWMAAKSGKWREESEKCKLVFDAHELFPEVPEIQGKPVVKWVWRTLERWLMPCCNARLTVCQSIADYYHRKLGVEMEVVRNLSSGEWRVENGERRVESEERREKMLLYQGAVNLGRGVDWAIDALEWLPECRLVVAGGGDLLEQMKNYAASKPWGGRVEFLGRLMPEELYRLTPQADVGLVMLEDMGLSYHYALPNRIGDFVQAGVPMVVSDLPEMAAVVRRFGVGEVMEAPGGKALAEAVQRVLEHGKKAYNFSAARKDMDWNKEKQKLIDIVNKLN